MKFVSWNVAGFRACLNKGFDDFFKAIDADVFAIQESKATEDQFDYRPEGYEMILYPAEKKGYSGQLQFYRKRIKGRLVSGLSNQANKSTGWMPMAPSADERRGQLR